MKRLNRKSRQPHIAEIAPLRILDEIVEDFSLPRGPKALSSTRKRKSRKKNPIRER